MTVLGGQYHRNFQLIIKVNSIYITIVKIKYFLQFLQINNKFFIFLLLLPTMAINPVRIDYLTVCGFIHSRYKFCVQVNIISETVENLFSAGLTNTNTVKTYNLQHCIL
jgi:hypothetical protein